MLNMNKKLLLRILLPLMLVLILIIPITAGASDAYPKSIAGFPVVFVKNAQNTLSLTGDDVVLVIYAKDATSEDVLAKLEEEKYNGSYSLEFFGGPNASPKRYYENHQKNQDTLTEYGLNQLTDYGRTFAIYQDNDIDAQNVNGLSAEFRAPVKGDNQAYGWSAFLLNGITTESWFMQVGFVFPQSSGDAYIAYTNTEFGLEAQEFSNVDYTAGHDYFFYFYCVNENLWTLGVEDIDTEDWQVYVEYEFDGIELEADPDHANSVFFENTNYTTTPTAWYVGFDEYVWATNAKDHYEPYTWSAWSSGEVLILDRYGSSESNGGKITGSLTNGYTAVWDLEELLTLSD